MAEDAPPPSSPQLTLRLTNHPVQGQVECPHSVTPSETVGQLKEQLHREWDGKPAADGILCVKGGRVCKDTELLGELFSAETPAAEAVLHVIVKPTAWTKPFSSLPAPTPTVPLPAAQATPAAHTPSVVGTPSVTPYNPSDTAPPPADTPASPVENLLSAFTTTFAGETSLPTPNAPVSSTTASLSPSVSGFPTYLALLSQLIPLQRSLLLLNLQKAHYFYSVDVVERMARLGWAEPTDKAAELQRKEGLTEGEELEEVKGLLEECNLWSAVVDKEAEAEVEIQKWEDSTRVNAEFQLVQINGLPFMLQAPNAEGKQVAPDLAMYRSLKRGEAILRTLTTMLQLLITYQPTAPGIAYGRALLRPPGTAAAAAAGGVAAAAGGQVVAAVPAAALAAAQRRRATVSIVINLEAVLSLIVPLFLLSLKLGFLLWIFGRHASYTKRIVMASMAGAWILWEGVGMYRRRAVAGALRDRADRERERAERQARRADAAAQAGFAPMPQAAAPLRPPPAPAAPAPAADGRELRRRVIPAGAVPPAGAPAPGHPAPRGHHRPPGRPRREPHSRFSPRYWIARIATIGLVEEAHELGLAPRTVAGRHVPQPPPPPHPNDRVGLARQARRGAFRIALVALVLFFGTLSPEVERKRKRALEKRERLLAEKRVQRERQAAERAAAATGGEGGVVEGQPNERGVGLQPPEQRSGTSTPGLFEGDHNEATLGLPQHQPEASTSASPAPLPSPTTHDDTDRTPTTSPAGRAVVSDAELFADGLGEPDQEPLALGGTTSPGEPVTDGDGTEGDGEGETETSEDEDERRAGGAEDEGEVDQVVALF